MEVIAGPAHVKPGIGWFLQCGRGLSQCIVVVVVRLRALERCVVLREVWLNEGYSVCWFHTGQEGRTQSLEQREQRALTLTMFCFIRHLLQYILELNQLPVSQ